MIHFHPGLTSMLRCTISSVTALAVGLFLVSSASAPAQQSGGEQKPPEQTLGEQKPEQKDNAQKTANDAERQAVEKTMQEYREAATKLPRSAGAAECVWTGRRIASLLWRDDIDTASRYIDLYDRFNCSADHLKLVFRCVIQQGPIDPKAADRLASRVHDCWMSPDAPTTAASQATTDTPKAGTIPN
jgi:hypothetical protein